MVGEHIRVRKGGRWQHAIDCGDETVLHLSDEPGESPLRVRRSYRPEFVGGAEAVEVVTHRERTFPPNEVIARAFSRIADPVLASMFRDSEAFAKWCATGRIPSGLEAGPAQTPAPAAPPAGRVAGSTPRKRKASGARGKPRPARKGARSPARARVAGKASARKSGKAKPAKAKATRGKSPRGKGAARSGARSRGAPARKK